MDKKLTLVKRNVQTTQSLQAYSCICYCGCTFVCSLQTSTSSTDFTANGSGASAGMLQLDR